MLITMDFQELTKDKLWLTLVETVHANVMYPTHKSYTRDVILKAKPEIAHEELAAKLNMPVGEAMVIIYELTAENKIST
jgi:hypothetical protein